MSNKTVTSSRGIIRFFALALAFTWSILLTEAAVVRGWLPFHLPQPLLMLSGFGPAFAALIVVGRQNGRTGIRQLLGRLKWWRVGWHWYTIVMLGPALLLVTAVMLASFNGPAPNFGQTQVAILAHTQGISPWLLLPIHATLLFITLLGEEIGWRGLALPELLRRFNPTAASLILGILWGVWHLPMIWVPALGAGVASVPLGWFLVDIVAMSLLYTWIFQHTQGSLLIATLLHTANNTAAAFIPLLPPAATDLRPFLINIALKWVLIGLIFIFSKAWDWLTIGQSQVPRQETTVSY